MLITLKSLQHETFKLEIDPEQTVLDLKKKIEETKGTTYGASHQKLIYAGKVMEDSSKLSEYNIEEKKFIVVMMVPPKSSESTSSVGSTSGTQKNSNPSSQSVTTPGNSSPAAPTSASESQAPSKLPTTSPTTAEPAQAKETATSLTAAESNLVFGDELEKSIKQIMEMGYERDQVERAMRASFNNPERAVEYLISGLPTNIVPDLEATSPASVDTGSSVTATSAENAPPTEANPLEFLRNQPVFNQMRQLLQQNPQVLSSLMQSIGQSNPQLLELINQNQESFVRMLNEPDNPNVGAPTGASPAAGGQQSNLPPGLDNLIGHAPMTPQDREAIDRLKALGFPEYLVIQAYFAFDKNENSAANFLFSAIFEEN
ncbi:UV excision repair protein Rad23 [Brevipalpus obovatus]|uniref:UV excision repair protein Rad23 n=1 Tax=Brevipalpus obovatus TaxID=246614 RepID=UPI003D9E5B20